MRTSAGGWRDAGDVLRPVWAEVNLAHIRHNVKSLYSLLAGKSLLAVVKANAYGHGAGQVARTALSAGATWLGVASPEEGISLRQLGIAAPILVLGAFFPGQEQAFFDYDLTATVATEEAAATLSHLAAQGRPLSVHLKVDTGMGRLGWLAPGVVAAARTLVDSGVRIDGLYTHLATADAANLEFAHRQLARFHQVRQDLAAAGVRPRWLHAGNGAALFRLPMDEFNLVRPGLTMYGMYPSPYVPRRVELRPALTWRAQAVAVRRLPAGSPISYGCTYTTSCETNIVTLPLGYADGYSRRLSNKAQVLLGGSRFPVVGNITMDQCLVDVGDYPARVGEEVVLLGSQGEETITADELAAILGTINYEVVCMIGARVPRVYVEESE